MYSRTETGAVAVVEVVVVVVIAIILPSELLSFTCIFTLAL